MSGLIGVKNTQLARKFFKDFNSMINYKRWADDQVILNKLVNKYNPKNIYDVGVKYLDWDFHPDSSIWSAKGIRKEKNDVFLSESAKYQ